MTMDSQLQLLEAEKAGDENALAQLVEPYRVELHAHCYRMLGSVPDAEDALQEALLRAWRGLPRFEGRSSLRSWLYKIATNACLRAIERRPKRVLPIDYAPAADPHDGPAEPVTEAVWLEPYPAERLRPARPPARPHPPSEQPGDAALAGRPRAEPGRAALRHRLGAQRRGRGRRHARRRREDGNATPANLVPRTRPGRHVPQGLAAGESEPLAPHPGSRQRATRLRRLHLGPEDTDLHAPRHHRFDTTRHADRREHRLPHLRRLPQIQPSRRHTR